MWMQLEDSYMVYFRSSNQVMQAKKNGFGLSSFLVKIIMSRVNFFEFYSFEKLVSWTLWQREDILALRFCRKYSIKQYKLLNKIFSEFWTCWLVYFLEITTVMSSIKSGFMKSSIRERLLCRRETRNQKTMKKPLQETLTIISKLAYPLQRRVWRYKFQ